MIPEPGVARVLNNHLEAAFWPPPQLPSRQVLLKDASAHGTAGQTEGRTWRLILAWGEGEAQRHSDHPWYLRATNMSGRY